MTWPRSTVDGLLKRCDRALLDLLRRRGHPERLVMPGCQVADENAVAVLLRFSEMVGERARLLEAVEEPPVDGRDVHARAGDPLLHRLPLFVCEVRFGSHAEEYGC